MSGAVRLDPFTRITAVQWSSGVAVLFELRGFALTAGIDGGDQSGGWPQFQADVVPSGYVDIPRNVGAGEVFDARNFVYTGRALANPSVENLRASLQFPSVLGIGEDGLQEPPNESFFSIPVFIDGAIRTWQYIFDYWMSLVQGRVVISKWSFNHGHDWSLAYYDLVMSKPDYIDLFSDCVIVGLSSDMRATVKFQGNPQEPIAVSVTAKAYGANSTFVARAGGTVDVFQASVDPPLQTTVAATALWSSSGSLSQFGQQLAFDKQGAV